MYCGNANEEFNFKFNKIAIQGTPQMAADKEAISLSIVLSVTRLDEIFVYSVLEHN